MKGKGLFFENYIDSGISTHNAHSSSHKKTPTPNQTDGFSPERVEKLSASELYVGAQWLQHRRNTPSKEHEWMSAEDLDHMKLYQYLMFFWAVGSWAQLSTHCTDVLYLTVLPMWRDEGKRKM